MLKRDQLIRPEIQLAAVPPNLDKEEANPRMLPSCATSVGGGLVDGSWE